MRSTYPRYRRVHHWSSSGFSSRIGHVRAGHCARTLRSTAVAHPLRCRYTEEGRAVDPGDTVVLRVENINVTATYCGT